MVSSSRFADSAPNISTTGLGPADGAGSGMSFDEALPNRRESKIRGLEAGASDFLAKPVDEAELALRVKNLPQRPHDGTEIGDAGKP